MTITPNPRPNVRVEPIRPGDRFSDGRTTWTVLQTLPGGRLDLFDETRTRFRYARHHDVRTWQRVKNSL